MKFYLNYKQKMIFCDPVASFKFYFIINLTIIYKHKQLVIKKVKI